MIARNFSFPVKGVFDFSKLMFGKFRHLKAKIKYGLYSSTPKLPTTACTNTCCGLAFDDKPFIPRPAKYVKPVDVDPSFELRVYHSDEPKFHSEWGFPDEPIASALQNGQHHYPSDEQAKESACESKQIILMVP